MHRHRLRRALRVASIIPVAAVVWAYAAQAQGAPATDAATAAADVLALLLAHPWGVYVLIGLSAAPWLAAILPQAAPGSTWATIRGLLDVLAGNVGNAANAALTAPAGALATATPGAGLVLTAEHVLQAMLNAHGAGVASGLEMAKAGAVTPPPAPAVPAPASGPISALLGLALLGGVLAVSACASTGKIVAPQTADQVVYEAEAGYIAAETQATAYASLPRCKAASGLAVCADQAIVDKLVRAQLVASNALDKAKAALALSHAVGAGASSTATLSAATAALVQSVSALAALAATAQH